MIGASARGATPPQTATPVVELPSALRGKTNLKNSVPWMLLGLVLGYVLWAAVEEHQKIREAIEPKNIKVNLRNMFLILFTVVLGMTLLKVGLAKLAGWGIPGAAQLLRIVSAA